MVTGTVVSSRCSDPIHTSFGDFQYDDEEVIHVRVGSEISVEGIRCMEAQGESVLRGLLVFGYPCCLLGFCWVVTG